MASRTAFPGTATDSTVHAAADDNKLPGGWIGFAEVTADISGISAITDLTGLSQTVTVNTSRKIAVTFYAARTSSTVAADRFRYYLREGSTTLQTATEILDFANVGTTIGVIRWVGNPSSGSHTYKVSLERITGTGTLTMAASSTEPAQLVIEDVGPSS